MKVSYFESVRYVAPEKLPPRWPLPPGLYEPEVGRRVFQGVLDRLAYVEALGFDWVSVSEHHYSARILSPSPIVMASHIAAHFPALTLRSTCGEKPKAKDVSRPLRPCMRHGQGERNPVSLLQCPFWGQIL